MYDRRSRGSELDFGHTGKLRENGFVFYERLTHAHFCQPTGECLGGPDAGRILTRIPSHVLPWGAWVGLHPWARALEPPAEGRDRYWQNPYSQYRLSHHVGIHPLRRFDGRLAAKSLVLGVTVGRKARCWPAALLDAARVVNDTVGDVPVAVAWDSPGRWGTCLMRRSAGRVFELSPAGAGLLAGPGGSRWDMLGRCLGSGCGGARLALLPAVVCYWFAWQAHYPGTEVAGLAGEAAGQGPGASRNAHGVATR